MAEALEKREKEIEEEMKSGMTRAAAELNRIGEEHLKEIEI